MGGNVTVRLNLNSAGYSAEMVKAQRAMQGFSSATAAMGHGTVSQMQAASAAIRVLEGGMTGNIRAAERFISTIPGVGKALQAIFPLVGGIALAGVFVKIGEEAAKAIQKIQQAPQAIANSFREMNLSAETSIDTLKLSTAKMEEQIALLSGKRPNTLAIELAEASLAADKLATSLDNDNRKIAELLKTNGTSFWSGFLGKAGTADVAGSVNSFDQQMADLAARRQHAVRTGDTSGAASLGQQLDDKRNAALAYANSQISQRQNQGVGGLDQDANLAVLTGFRNTLVDQQDQQKAEASNTATSAQLKKIEDAKKYADLLKQAQEKIVQQWQKDLDEQKPAFDSILVQEAQFWVRRMESARKGSLSYIAAMDEANKAIGEMHGQNIRGGKEFDQAAATSYLPGNMDLSRGDTGDLKDQGRQSSEYIKSLNDQISAQRQAATAIAEQSVAMQVATGQMSKLDAAQALAAIHTRDYARAQERLQTALANASLIPGMAGQTAVAALNAQGAQMAGQRAIQVAQDQQNVSGNTLSGAATDALRQMVQSWEDMAANLKNVIPTLVQGLNGDLAKLITGQGSRKDFGHTLMQSGQGLVKTALGGLEGRALSALHLGGKKPDGTRDNRMFVSALIEGSGGSVASPGGVPLPSGAVGSLLGKIPSFNGSAWGSVLTGVASFLPHFAGGGDVLANHPSIVGERGPELFMPRTSGSIVPNHALGGGAGDNHFHFNIQGNQDPAAVEAAIRRAAPHIVAAAVQANHQSGKRNPGR